MILAPTPLTYLFVRKIQSALCGRTLRTHLQISVEVLILAHIPYVVCDFLCSLMYASIFHVIHGKLSLQAYTIYKITI